MKTNIKIKFWILLFIIGLLISGITAFPLEWELKILNNYLGTNSTIAESYPDLSAWITKVYLGLSDTNQKYPFLSYGTDWLAFAHIVLAILFIGPLRDPIKNIWVIEFGIISCTLVIPLALICGHIREIPLFWQMIDCSFGILGIIPLLIVRKQIKLIEHTNH
ncbi:MAG: hypothetical protein COA79_08250 [Planctomycetota bacterium]|nr:MAG: hypothetical protein COA79_08250 [Planctomycetota bacterium]